MTRGTIPVRPDAGPEKILTLSDARAVAQDRVRIENFPHVIWWVMAQGYVVVPKGTRPQWFFANEEETFSPPND